MWIEPDRPAAQPSAHRTTHPHSSCPPPLTYYNRKYISNLEHSEAKRYLEMFYILKMRALIEKMSEHPNKATEDAEEQLKKKEQASA